MNCPNPQCKTTNIPDDAKFCPNCGQRLAKDLVFNISGVSFIMNYVEGGSFMMGASDSYTDYDERPQHKVTLNSYFMGETLVTQALWKEVMNDNPSKFGGDNLPVENVSWDECQDFISKLNAITGKTFTLPTEAQWEYAARGGAISRNKLYSGGDNILLVAWHADNSDRQTHPVGLKAPNELGLYDMSGNVWEWCSDYYSDYYYKNSPKNNPHGPISGKNRVLRGGSWECSPRYCRITQRIDYRQGYRNSFIGLRLALLQTF